MNRIVTRIAIFTGITAGTLALIFTPASSPQGSTAGSRAQAIHQASTR